MKRIKLEIIHGVVDDAVLDLEITEIPHTDCPDYMKDEKIHYDTYEYISFASDDYEVLKKLLTFRSNGLYEYILGPHIFGNHQLTDKYIKLLISSENQDTYPELYI